MKCMKRLTKHTNSINDELIYLKGESLSSKSICLPFLLLKVRTCFQVSTQTRKYSICLPSQELLMKERICSPCPLTPEKIMGSKFFSVRAVSHWTVRQTFSVNLYQSLGIFSRWQIDDIFLIFPSKQDSTFYANCLLRRQFAWNVKSCFLGKIRKNISKCRLLKILPRVLSVKGVSSLECIY